MQLPEAIDAEIFEHISSASRQLGSPAFVIGGYVRDWLLERHRDTKDIDVVCLGSGIELAHEAARLCDPSIKVHFFKNFGTAMFRFGDWEIEFVGARKESYRRNSRKPIVEEGSLEDDQNRRDFTINALAISLNQTDYGRLIDPFGGRIHLDEKLLKTPLDPDLTFSDDPLRMMRAIRFASQLQFRIDPHAYEAIGRNAERIRIVSRERITDELNKIICAPKPSIGFKHLFHTGLLQGVFPGDGSPARRGHRPRRQSQGQLSFIRCRSWTTSRKTPMTSGCAGPPSCTTLPNHRPRSLKTRPAGRFTVTKCWVRGWYRAFSVSSSCRWITK